MAMLLVDWRVVGEQLDYWVFRHDVVSFVFNFGNNWTDLVFYSMFSDARV